MCNSSYNLIPILLKLCRHCDHALKICVWLGYTPQINFINIYSSLGIKLNKIIYFKFFVRVPFV